MCLRKTCTERPSQQAAGAAAVLLVRHLCDTCFLRDTCFWLDTCLLCDMRVMLMQCTKDMAYNTLASCATCVWSCATCVWHLPLVRHACHVAFLCDTCVRGRGRLYGGWLTTLRGLELVMISVPCCFPCCACLSLLCHLFYVTWLQIFGVTHWYVWYDLFTPVTWRSVDAHSPMTIWMLVSFALSTLACEGDVMHLDESCDACARVMIHTSWHLCIPMAIDVQLCKSGVMHMHGSWYILVLASLMWRVWVSHHTRESCMSHVTHDWVMSHMTESCHTWLSHVTHDWVMSHTTESCHTWLSHVTHDWVMKHVCLVWVMIHVGLAWVMSHVMIHVGLASVISGGTSTWWYK